jgi:hypothetical protein
MDDFSQEVRGVLLDAGWHPARQVDVTAWRGPLATGGLAMHPAAERFLAEFGGLTFDLHGPGISAARVPFELDPLLCLGEEDRFAEWSAVVHRSLFPLGELDEGRFFLGIDETSEVYLVVDWLATYGPARLAMDRLILGTAPETLWEEYPG